VPKLSVNVDHVATVRQARGGKNPDPVTAALLAELAGADGIIVHLREDRRHIQDRDVEVLRRVVKTRLNLEMANTEELVRIALRVKPDMVCLVPERRQELTTEGGLDVRAQKGPLKRNIARLKKAGIRVSLFIDADPVQVKASRAVGADFVEIHTGKYSDAPDGESQRKEFHRIGRAIAQARTLGLRVNIGHGLDYQNVSPFTSIPEIEDYSIGHSIMARAILVGLDRAVREMKELIQNGAFRYQQSAVSKNTPAVG
jgi:pyridoxine 5-phosphate synthase